MKKIALFILAVIIVAMTMMLLSSCSSANVTSSTDKKTLKAERKATKDLVKHNKGKYNEKVGR